MNQPSVPTWARQPRVRIGAVVAIALAIGFVVWLIVIAGCGSSSSGTSSSTQTVASIGPTAVGVDRLSALSDEAGHPIYWAGPGPSSRYELTRTSSGRIFLRYLPRGVAVGTTGATYTIVGSYPVDGAYKVLNGLAKSGDTSFSVPGGGLAVYSKSAPTNVYLAYPDSDVEIEVYDPSPERARSLVTSGQITPVP